MELTDLGRLVGGTERVWVGTLARLAEQAPPRVFADKNVQQTFVKHAATADEFLLRIRGVRGLVGLV